MAGNGPEPPDAGQRNRHRRRKKRPRLRTWLVNRRTLMTALWVARAIVQLVRLIKDLIDGF